MKERRTIVHSPAVAGTFKRELIERGATDVQIKSHGSDSKRGSKPYFVITWKEAKDA